MAFMDAEYSVNLVESEIKNELPLEAHEVGTSHCTMHKRGLPLQRRHGALGWTPHIRSVECINNSGRGK